MAHAISTSCKVIPFAFGRRRPSRTPSRPSPAARRARDRSRCEATPPQQQCDERNGPTSRLAKCEEGGWTCMPNETPEVNVTPEIRAVSRVRKRHAQGGSCASYVQHRPAKSNCDAVQIVSG